MFAKNERGYRLNAIKKRFWSLLIFLLSVASIRRKLLKTSINRILGNYLRLSLWYINRFTFKDQYIFFLFLAKKIPVILDEISSFWYKLLQSCVWGRVFCRNILDSTDFSTLTYTNVKRATSSKIWTNGNIFHVNDILM